MKAASKVDSLVEMTAVKKVAWTVDVMVDLMVAHWVVSTAVHWAEQSVETKADLKVEW